MNDVSVILTVHNQESLIKAVAQSLIINSSENVKEYIFVLDGCTDSTEEVLLSSLDSFNVKSIIEHAPNVWETRANNIGLKLSTCKYSLIVQDDMILTEKEYDKRLMKPFYQFDNLLGVTARNAQNESIVDGNLRWFDMAGKDAQTDRNLFAVRDVIVRGPILFDNDKLQLLNYLDENFAPLDSDDKDLCFRAYRKGMIVGSYQTDYVSELSWGKTRSDVNSYMVWELSAQKNVQLLIERHSDLIMGVKHNIDRMIE